MIDRQLLPATWKGVAGEENKWMYGTFSYSLHDYVKYNEMWLSVILELSVTHQPNGSQISSSLKLPLSKTNQRNQASTPLHPYSLTLFFSPSEMWKCLHFKTNVLFIVINVSTDFFLLQR